MEKKSADNATKVAPGSRGGNSGHRMSLKWALIGIALIAFLVLQSLQSPQNLTTGLSSTRQLMELAEDESFKKDQFMEMESIKEVIHALEKQVVSMSSQQTELQSKLKEEEMKLESKLVANEGEEMKGLAALKEDIRTLEKQVAKLSLQQKDFRIQQEVHNEETMKRLRKQETKIQSPSKRPATMEPTQEPVAHTPLTGKQPATREQEVDENKPTRENHPSPCLELRGKEGKWIPSTGYDYTIRGKQVNNTLDFPNATKWQWQDELCPMQMGTREGFCSVLHQLGIGRIFLVGDSLTEGMKKALQKLLGGFPLSCEHQDSGRSIKFQIQVEYLRNDHLFVTPWLDTKKNSCHDRCHSWIEKFASVPTKTLLIVNTGLHTTVGDPKEKTVEYQGNIDQFVEGVTNLNRVGDLVMYRTSVPGHNNCFEHQAPFANYSQFRQYQDVESRYKDYGWDLVDGFNEYVQNKWSNLSSTRVDHQPSLEGPHWHMLDVYPMTVLRPDGHSGPLEGHGDCLHYKHPGPVDWWIHLLYSNLLDIATTPTTTIDD